MGSEKLYTQQELDIELIKQQNEGVINKIEFIGRNITQSELDIELLKQKHEDIYINFNHVYKTLERIESQQKWIFGLIGTGFIGLLSLMAHGFKWII